MHAVPPSAPERGGTLLLYTVLLSGVGGYVDAAGFVALLGFFPAHITGELVGDAIAISSGQWAAHVARLWMFPVFILSIALTSLVARFLRRRKQPELTGLLALLAASLALFSACDAVAHLLHHRHLPLWFSGACAVTAMGFQTALIRVSLSGSCPTTVMTGNLAQVIVDLLDRLVGARDARASQRSRLVSACGALAAFASCATLGGWLTQRFGTLSVAVPTLVTAALAVRAWVEDRRSALSVERPATASPWFNEDDDLWPDSSETEALAPLYGVELESVTRIKTEPAVAVGSVAVSSVAVVSTPAKAGPPRYASGVRPALLSRGGK
ncbi:MAG: YoaK family protein [Pseudomonadota bacterium]